MSYTDVQKVIGASDLPGKIQTYGQEALGSTEAAEKKKAADAEAEETPAADAAEDVVEAAPVAKKAAVVAKNATAVAK